MSKTIDPRKRAAPTPPAADGALETGESLDKVRDILFGGQMRMVESRLQGLEARLQAEQQAMRTDLGRQLAEVDGAIRREVAALGERLAAERAKRAEDLKALGAELKDAIKSLEKRHGKLEEAASLADAEIRDQILRQANALTTEITRVAERLAGDLDRSAKALQAEKLDTATLAGLLGELSSRLAGNGRSQSKGGARG